MGLTQEGYSPGVVRLVLRQAAQVSFAEASGDLQALADIEISPTHVRRLAERVGREWADARDAEVDVFRNRTPAPQTPVPKASKTQAEVGVVMLDGGRVQTRAANATPGVSDPQWKETKVACCLSLVSREKAVDPQPEPPSKLLRPVEVARLTAELKSRGRPSRHRPAGEVPSKTKKKRRRRGGKNRPRKLVRTVVASMADSETFGYQVAAEVDRRGLDRVARKACVCDGLNWNWSVFAMHLVGSGFIGILDVLHLVSYLYAAAHAVADDKTPAWSRYEQWLRWAWGGRVGLVLKALREASAKAGEAPAGAKEDDPRVILSEALGYVRNNQDKMKYPEYRRMGLPISSAPVESVVKQVNRRVKGTEKFWVKGDVEAILQLRAAYLSEDGRAEQYAARPRPRGRAVGTNRLGRTRTTTPK